MYWSCTVSARSSTTCTWSSVRYASAKKGGGCYTRPTLDHHNTQPQPQPQSQRAAQKSHTHDNSSSEVVHVSDDEDEMEVEQKQPSRSVDEQERLLLHVMREEQGRATSRAAPVIAKQSVSGDQLRLQPRWTTSDDLFPADFFDAFDQPAISRAHSSIRLLSHITTSSPLHSHLHSAEVVASPVRSRQLTLGESIKQRRPRMRLKKLDVKEIIWSATQQPHTHDTYARFVQRCSY